MPSKIQPPRAERCHCFTIRRAARQISRFYDAHLQSTGLRITQFLTLLMLSDVPSATMSELAERLDVEPTAMGKMVGTLARDGLVSIQRSPTDGRSRIVQLTDAGRRLFDQATPLWQNAQRDFERLNDEAAINALRPGFALPGVSDMQIRSTTRFVSGG